VKESKRRFGIRSTKSCFLHFNTSLWTRSYDLNSTVHNSRIVWASYKFADVSPRSSSPRFLPKLPKLTQSMTPLLDSLLPAQNVFEAIRLCLCGSTNSQRLLMTESEQRTIAGFEHRGRILLLCRVVQGDDIDDEMR